MGKIINVNFPKYYAPELAPHDAIREAIHQFDDKISLVSCLGVLEVIKNEILEEAAS